MMIPHSRTGAKTPYSSPSSPVTVFVRSLVLSRSNAISRPTASDVYPNPSQPLIRQYSQIRNALPNAQPKIQGRREKGRNSPLHNPLQCRRGQIRVVGNGIDDRHQTRELVAGAICQYGRDAGGLHLGVCVVQLDDAGGEVFAREDSEAVFYQLRDFGLGRECQLCVFSGMR